jgi:hypothetical protein
MFADDPWGRVGTSLPESAGLFLETPWGLFPVHLRRHCRGKIADAMMTVG